MLNKRELLKAIGALPIAWCGARPVVANAQSRDFPTKAITLVAPYGPGNTADMIARLVGQHLGTLLGQQVIVDNRPGGGGIGAINQVARAAPDGHTLLMVGTAAAISQSLFKPPPYDMLKSFVPVSTLASTDVLLLVGKSSKLNKVEDFIRDAKERKRDLTVGVSLLGTTQHLSAELFKLNAKVDYTIVPFKSASEISTALVAGHVDAAFELISPMMGMINSGRVRALAIGSAKRSDLLPEVPTVGERGVPYFEVMAWGMVVAPAQTPDAIVQRLNAEIQRVLNRPDVVQRFRDVGQRPLGGTPAQARELLEGEITKWGKVIRDAKISLT